MNNNFFRITKGCPLFDSVRAAKGVELGNVPSRDTLLRCNHCTHWQGGQCGLFLVKSG